MPSKLKLFISHSSRLDDMNSDLPVNHNWQLLEETCRLLKVSYRDDIEILVDQDSEEGLYPGCDWEKRLNEWLAECHVAIILFSERARTTSNWVKKEATILSWRNEIQEDFTLIPVLLDQQTEASDLEKDLFGTLRINGTQCIKSVHSAQEIVVGIKKLLDAIIKKRRIEAPLERLERVIEALLNDSTSPSTLERAWNAIPDIEKPEWHPDSATRFASALARYLLRRGESSLKAYTLLLNEIRPRPNQDKAIELLEYIRSLWVEAKVASRLRLVSNLTLVSGKQQKYFLVMNGRKFDFTFVRYIERAWLISSDYIIVFISESTDLQAIHDQIRNYFIKKSKNNYSMNFDECDEYIKTFDQPILVYLPSSNDDGGGILHDFRLRNKLRELYPNIIFVLGTGEQLPPLEELPDDVLAIEPEIQSKIEQKRHWEEARTMMFIENYYGKRSL